MLNKTDLEELDRLSRQIRADIIRCSTSAGSGHPTSSLSATDLMAVLVTRHLHYDWDNPKYDNNDHLVFSKGHASPLLYSIYRAVGVIDEDELVNTYRRFKARLQGHPTPELPWVDLATGSLGVGIAACVGMALVGKELDQLDYRVYSLCGDSEFAEGSVWEALDKASFYKLNNLTVIVDINRLGQRGPTELEWDLEAYQRRVEAFGCQGIILDGHNFAEIDAALTAAREASRPTVLLAKTIKGKGVPEIEDKNGWHGTALPQDLAEKAIAYINPDSQAITVSSPKPTAGTSHIQHTKVDISAPLYELGEKIATRKAFGDGLAALAARPDVVVFDAEVGNSTHADAFGKVAPERYFEAFIAEQLMVAAAGGAATRGYVSFAATFAAFLSRAYDFVRMMGISEIPLHLSGSHCGVEIGADGPSQMALEDLASIRAIHGSTVLYPSDAVSAAALTIQMADLEGISYIRTTRGAYPVLYDNDEVFPVGGSKVVRKSPGDQVTLVGAGITLHESLRAAEMLASENISARVIDLYSVKPVDVETLIEALLATEGRIVVTEDHYFEGGLGEAVISAIAGKGIDLKIRHLAVTGLSCSGTADELLHYAHISADDITEAAKSIL